LLDRELFVKFQHEEQLEQLELNKLSLTNNFEKSELDEDFQPYHPSFQLMMINKQQLSINTGTATMTDNDMLRNIGKSACAERPSEQLLWPLPMRPPAAKARGGRAQAPPLTPIASSVPASARPLPKLAAAYGGKKGPEKCELDEGFRPHRRRLPFRGMGI